MPEQGGSSSVLNHAWDMVRARAERFVLGFVFASHVEDYAFG